MIGGSCTNWINRLDAQISFYVQSAPRERVDSEFDWPWFEGRQRHSRRSLAWRFVRRLLRRGRHRGSIQKDPEAFRAWLIESATELWSARSLFEDEFSKVLFDLTLVLRASGYRRFYFPRLRFNDFAEVLASAPFDDRDLPRDYLGQRLHVFRLGLGTRAALAEVSIVSTTQQIDMLNGTWHYLICRNGVDMAPRRNDVVLDCGACIGEFSMLFAALVGEYGAVHALDPVPLHGRFCARQGELNPALANVLKRGLLAVGAASGDVVGTTTDVDSITPGGLGIDSYRITSLDDYAREAKLSRVDVIKMDIEGAELDAIAGANCIIRDHKPRMAISAYHHPDHLWKIPHLIKEASSGYRLFFDHHSPVLWESVCYAAHASRYTDLQ